MRLSKYPGLGNDFLVLIDADGNQPVDADLARRVCDRHRGVGADGLIRTTRSKAADLVMELWNADGSRAEMSGNGIRCLVHAAVDAGLVHGPLITVATDAGVKAVSRRSSTEPGVARFSVDMGVAKITRLDDEAGRAEVD